MTRADKIEKRKRNALVRRIKNEQRNKLSPNTDLPMRVRRQIGKNGFANPWADSNSPTGYTQVCSYWATCSSPCNGDC